MTNDEIAEQLASLQREFKLYKINTDERLHDLADENAALRELMQKYCQLPKITGELPEFDRIKHMQVQVFHNAVRKQGACEWSLKLEFTYDSSIRSDLNVGLVSGQRAFKTALKGAVPLHTRQFLLDQPEDALIGFTRSRAAGMRRGYNLSQAFALRNPTGDLHQVQLRVLTGDMEIPFLNFVPSKGKAEKKSQCFAPWCRPAIRQLSLCI